MAGEDNYINEAYEVLQKLSADERKRLEYEARQKAIRDYDSQMSSQEKKAFGLEKIGLIIYMKIDERSSVRRFSESNF